MDKSLSEHMLPTPHITEAHDSIEQHPEAEAAYLQVLNTEAKLIASGADPRSLPLARLAINDAEKARKNVTDPMTGLLNREGMDMWMERNKPEVFGVIFADGRNFKQYNNISYEAGDSVIKQIGEKLAEKVRIDDPDENIAEKRKDPKTRDAIGMMRFGGDEFMVVVDLTSVDEAERETALHAIKQRLKNFGTFTDETSGTTLPIEVDSAAKIGYRHEQKSIDEYRKELDSELKLVKHAR